MFGNIDESALTRAPAAIENAYENVAGGISRFPGLIKFATFPGQRTYLSTWNGSLIAGTDAGRLYRIDRSGKVTDVTGVPISGGRRMIFSATEDQLVIAAGGAIISLSGERTEVLSPNAPPSTHVAFLRGYLLAIEANTERFQYCDPGKFTVWNPLSVFSANAKPGAVNSMVVTPYDELMLGKTDGIEQFEVLPNGTQPFSERWSTGEGVVLPYTLVADKTGTYAVNSRYEFVRFYGQISQDQSEAINLNGIDDWTDAWAQELTVKGQNFFILQAPNATNAYNTKGITYAFDYRNKKWCYLFGWDAKASLPNRFPAWSFQRLWGKIFAGVPGGVAVFDDATYQLQGGMFPVLLRTGHIDEFGPVRIDDVRIRVRRGDGTYQGAPPRIGLRVNPDNLGFDQWTYEPMGIPGQREMTIHFGGQGAADTFQFEIACTDNVPIELVSMEIYAQRIRF